MNKKIDLQKDGLTARQVAQSRTIHGENRLSRQKKKSLPQSFLESFGDPIIKILLIALAVNVLFLFREANWFEVIGIGVAILIATLVSTLSEHGSEAAFEKMQEDAARTNCRVLRRGGLVDLPVEELVVSDLVLLQPGDRVPGDGRLLEGTLEVDQSALNGESKEAKKFVDSRYESDAPSFLNPLLLFSGTVINSGDAWMEVTQVGDQTFFGKIGAELQQDHRESPLKIRLGELAKSIGRIGYAAAALTAISYLFRAVLMENNFDQALILETVTTPTLIIEHLIKAITLAVTVVVMAVPEGLPMMITVVLSANMKRMRADNVLVRRLVGLETAGSMNILFTDKTGTLTRGKLEVTHLLTGDASIASHKEFTRKSTSLTPILHAAILNNTAAILQGGVAMGSNATDRAVLAFANALPLSQKSQPLKKIATLPFQSETKFMATSVRGQDGKSRTLIKGAPEKILPQCKQFYTQSGAVTPLSSGRQRELNDQMNHLASHAVRLIAIAVGDVTVSPSSQKNVLQNLTLVAVLGIRDDLRPEAFAAVREVQGAGIQTVMITGDAPMTATAIAREVGILRSEQDVVLSSTEMQGLSDDALSALLPRLRVVARALPSDKSRLVRIAQQKDLVVGMTGDGVNDAPALKAADIGFAMGSGTEVAKEAGDIVILDNNFLSIVKAVSYGRTIFKSIRKFIIYQLSICMCAVLVTIMGPLIGVAFPITIIQMLWINIVMDTLAGMAFSGEKPRKAYLSEPPKRRDEPILNRYMKGQIAWSSIYSSLLCIFFLRSPSVDRLIASHTGTQAEVYKMTAFFALFMFLAIFTSFCSRTHSLNLMDHLAANKPFLFIMGLVSVIQLGILYYGGVIFRTVPLPVPLIAIIIVAAMSVIPVDLLRKKLIRNTVGVLGT